jgi:hypothetical protein
LQRIEVEPRQGWPAIIEEQGLIYWKTQMPDGSMMPSGTSPTPTR